MPAIDTAIRKILFVDDNATFLDMIEKVFLGWSQGGWHILRAPNPGRALSILEEQLVDLVVIEIRLPGVDGLQFLKMLNGRYGNIPKAILTSHADPENKAACLESGADVYIEKPRSLAGMEGVFATLNELSKSRRDGGFRGMLPKITLAEVMQLECLNKNSSILEVVSGIKRGQIFIQEGNIVHAHGGGHKGQVALTYLFSLKGGDFNLRAFSEPPEITISGSWEGLIMEAAQASDESAPALDEAAEKVELSAITQNLDTPFVLEGIQNGEPSKDANTTIFTDEVFAPRVEEILVCSARGKVLYESQCPKPELRIELMDVIRKKSGSLSKILGAFDRLDIKEGKDHIIVRCSADDEMFVHVHHPASVLAS